jgi:DNA-binding GntR family transcriptional regulator
MTRAVVKLPEHQAIYRQIRSMILFGVLVPGQAVTIQGLTDMIGAGVTPVREAIRRLTAEGALETGGNRRVRVPLINRATLDEIGFARLAVEPRLAELAAERMTDSCIADLAALDARVDDAIEAGNIEHYLEFNYRFHFRLYDQADAGVLSKIAASLWLQMGPSLRIVCGRYGTANLPDKHDEALAALREGNATRAAGAIADDIRQGLGQVRLTLEG